MGVTTTNNKPLNPRGNDQSPLAFNRAKLFSGKALDFDGVNDEVNIGAEGGTYNDFTLVWNLKTSYNGAFQAIFSTGSLQDFYIDPSGQFRIFIGTSYDTTTLPAINSGEWVNLVFTRSGSTGSFYYNGVLVETLTISTTAINNTDARIGANQYGSYPFNGEMAGFKLFNTALTAAQVADLYNNPEKVVPTGVDNTALKLWLPMQEGAGTTALNGAPDALGSEVVTNGTFDTDSDWNKGTGWTISGGKANASSATSDFTQTISYTLGKTYAITYTISNYSSGSVRTLLGAYIAGTTRSSNGTFIDFITPTNPSSNSFLYFEGITGFSGSIDNVSLKEVSGFGTISGATWTHGIGAPVAQTSVMDWNKNTLDGSNDILIPQGLTSGRDLLGNLFENVRKQGALNLDGNSWAEVHDNGSLDFGTGSFSLEAWVKVAHENTGSSYNSIIALGDSVNAANTAGLSINPSFIFLGWYNANAGISSATTEGDWAHILGTYDGTNYTLYLNGAQIDQDARTAVDITNADVKMIGRDSTTFRYYKDQIAQPRIYNRALTAAEVLQNYNSGKNTYTNN